MCPAFTSSAKTSWTVGWQLVLTTEVPALQAREGLQAVMELLHLFLEAPRWEQRAMERAKQMWLSHYRALGKGLERATADRIMTSMLGPDR